MSEPLLLHVRARHIRAPRRVSSLRSRVIRIRYSLLLLNVLVSRNKPCGGCPSTASGQHATHGVVVGVPPLLRDGVKGDAEAECTRKDSADAG